MIGELISELGSLIGRFLLHVALDLVFEILIKGAGYLIVRPFKRSVDPDGIVVVITGLAFWLTVGAVAFSTLT